MREAASMHVGSSVQQNVDYLAVAIAASQMQRCLEVWLGSCMEICLSIEKHANHVVGAAGVTDASKMQRCAIIWSEPALDIGGCIEECFDSYHTGVLHSAVQLRIDVDTHSTATEYCCSEVVVLIGCVVVGHRATAKMMAEFEFGCDPSLVTVVKTLPFYHPPHLFASSLPTTTPKHTTTTTTLVPLP
jgi:hypothetical protein